MRHTERTARVPIVARWRGTPLGPDLTDDEWVNTEGRPSRKQLGALIRAGVPRPVRHPAPMPRMAALLCPDL